MQPATSYPSTGTHGARPLAARLRAAQRHGNLDELNHVTALMLVKTLVPMGVRKRWSALDRLYHARFCECVVREGGGE